MAEIILQMYSFALNMPTTLKGFILRKNKVITYCEITAIED